MKNFFVKLSADKEKTKEEDKDNNEGTDSNEDIDFNRCFVGCDVGCYIDVLAKDDDNPCHMWDVGCY